MQNFMDGHMINQAVYRKGCSVKLTQKNVSSKFIKIMRKIPKWLIKNTKKLITRFKLS